MEGGEPPIDRAALAPHIGHGMREPSVEALRRIGTLSAPELTGVPADPEFHLAHAGASVKKLYLFAAQA